MLRGPALHAAIAAHSVRVTPWGHLAGDLGQVARDTRRRRSGLWFDLLAATLGRGRAPSQYLDLRWWELDAAGRCAYYTKVDLYRLHNLADAGARGTLRDKRRFLAAYRDLAGRAWLDLTAPELERGSPTAAQASTDAAVDALTGWLDNLRPERLIQKDPLSQRGRGVRIVDVVRASDGWWLDGSGVPDFVREARRTGWTLLEQCLRSHPAFVALGARSVGEVRITTRVLRDGAVDLAPAIMMVNFDHEVANGHRNYIICGVDTATGVVQTHGAPTGDPRSAVAVSPATGMPFRGFALPDWSAALDLVARAARRNPDLPTVGWDVAFTPDGPVLIEGNDNWWLSQRWAGGQSALVRRWLSEVQQDRVQP